jgi:hypothetical protein
MSRYRYEAILHVGHEKAALSEDEFSDWAESKWTLDDIRSTLLQRPNQRINIKRIRNARVEKDLTALASVIRLNPAIRDRVKSGHRAWPKT